jgi:hypothetical protein
MRGSQPDQPQADARSAGIDQIAYCSLLTPELLAYGRRRLIEEGGRANVAAGITGLVMMDGKLILHWFEGPSDKVKDLWQKIQADSRHHCIVQLFDRKQVGKRLFADHSLRRASRHEMMALVREAMQESRKASEAAAFKHAISILGILMDPEYADFYLTKPNLSTVDVANEAQAATKR